MLSIYFKRGEDNTWHHDCFLPLPPWLWLKKVVYYKVNLLSISIFSIVKCIGRMWGADLSWTAQSGLGMLGLLCVCPSLLSCWPAEAGLRLGAGRLQFCGAWGTWRALIHWGFKSRKDIIGIPFFHQHNSKQEQYYQVRMADLQISTVGDAGIC